MDRCGAKAGAGVKGGSNTLPLGKGRLTSKDCRASTGCCTVNAGTPGLKMPAFSRAISCNILMYVTSPKLAPEVCASYRLVHHGQCICTHFFICPEYALVALCLVSVLAKFNRELCASELKAKVKMQPVKDNLSRSYV